MKYHRPARPAHRAPSTTPAAWSRSATSRTSAAPTGWPPTAWWSPPRTPGRRCASTSKAVNRLAGPRSSPPASTTRPSCGRSCRGLPYERVLRRFVNAGHGVARTPRTTARDKRYAHPDVLVAGRRPGRDGGRRRRPPAQARRCLLVEEEHGLGGHLRWGQRRRPGGAGRPGGRGRRRAGHRGADRRGGARAATTATAIAVLRAAARPARGAERLDPGARQDARGGAGPDRAAATSFAGNDLPGVMLSTAVRRLINLYAVEPGQRAVVLTANPDGDAAIADLKRAGRRGASGWRTRGPAATSSAATGRAGVRAVQVADGTRIDCDLLVTAVGWTAPTSLLTRLRRPARVYSPQAARFFPDASRLPEDVLVTGGIAGDGSVEELTAHAAAWARRPRAGDRRGADRRRPTRRQPRPRRQSATVPHERGGRGRATPFGIFLSFRWTRTRSCSPAGPTGSWTSARTCRPRTCARRSRGLRRRRAGQALHHRHDGPAAGQARDGQHGGGGGRRHRRHDRRDRHHHLAAARTRRSRSARWPGGRSSRCATPRCSRWHERARRRPAGRWRVDPPGPLRRPGGGGAPTSASTSASSTSPRSASWTCAAPTCPRC